MINEQLGSELTGSNIKKKTQEYAFNEVGKGNITQPMDAIVGVQQITKDLGEEENVEQIIRKPLKKGITNKLIGKSKMKKPIGKLFSLTKEELENIKKESLLSLQEKWSEKYKKSIDCKNPKGFSQRAHCQGKKKKVSEEKLKGGKADQKTFDDLVVKYKKHGKNISDVEKMLKKQLNKGIKVEMEHTTDKERAKEIAMDHLYEDPIYYDKLSKIESKESMGAASAGGFVGPVGFNPQSDFVKKSFKETPKKVEATEATGASSAGSYVTPAAWAKSMNKKDWRGKSKTQLPGGKFVQVKKKCKKFPYCNQGDIKALKLSEQKETLRKIIDKVSQKYNVSESFIIDILKSKFPKSNNHK